MNGNAAFTDGACSLRMETPPLRVRIYPLQMETPHLRIGDVPFADGNAAARTFGRAHRRRPYHFSYGSVSQGCWRGARRRTKTRNDCWRGARRWTKLKKIVGEVLAADIPCCLSQEKSSPPIFRVVYRRKRVRRRYSALFIAGKEFADGLTRKKVGGEGLNGGIMRCCPRGV